MTTKGDVSNIEYAQQRSETREVAELIWFMVLASCSIVPRLTYQNDSQDPPCRWQFKCLNATEMKDEEAR